VFGYLGMWGWGGGGWGGGGGGREGYRHYLQTQISLKSKFCS